MQENTKLSAVAVAAKRTTKATTLMTVSIIICTFNRASYLGKAIDSLLKQNCDWQEVEIIVVDNASTDETRSTVESRARRSTRLRYHYEQRPGLSNARDCGVAHSEGEIVAFLDDDAIASPNWIQLVSNGFRTKEGPVGCIGGKVSPIWETPRPDWLKDPMLPLLTIIDWSNEEIAINPPKFLAGANFAVLKSALAEVGGFHPELGRVGTNLMSNEEILLQRLLARAGYKLYYLPKAEVFHHISENRLHKEWFYRRHWSQGVSDGVMEHYLSKESPYRRRIRGLRTIAAGILNIQHSKSLVWRRNENLEFESRCMTLGKIGYGVGLLKA